MHFPPNARRRYDDSLVPDCEGGFAVWWRQNMPGYNNGLRNNANQPMLSWFPYLYY